VFPFDDSTSLPAFVVRVLSMSLTVFDNGGLKDDPARAQQLVDSLLAGMREECAQLPSGGYSPLVRVHNTVWQRVAQV
jgi:hypothetical protein